MRNLRQRSLRVGERNADTLWSVCLCRLQSYQAECEPTGDEYAFIYSTYTDYSCASTAIDEYDYTGFCMDGGDTDDNTDGSYMWTCESASYNSRTSSRPSIKYFGTSDCTGPSYVGHWPVGEPTGQLLSGYKYCASDVGAPSSNRPRPRCNFQR